MSESGKSLQMTLNIFGFIFIVLGIGLEGGLSFFLLILAITMFIAALIIAAARGGKTDEH